ncbi:hypothetical protein D3C81_1602580 [compost metagenome]
MSSLRLLWERLTPGSVLTALLTVSRLNARMASSPITSSLVVDMRSPRTTTLPSSKTLSSASASGSERTAMLAAVPPNKILRTTLRKRSRGNGSEPEYNMS